MKTTRFMCIAHVLCVMCLAVGALAQTGEPRATLEQKNAVLSAQHKLDLIVKQQSDLALQIVDLQKKISDASTQLGTQRQQAEAELKKANEAVTAGIDAKAWAWHDDSLTFTAVPTPAAPANASTQPAKPASSPGAAAPPVQQAKK